METNMELINISILSAVVTSSISLIAFLIVRRLKLRNNNNESKIRRTKPSRTLAVLGSGGHTTEMIRLLSSLNKENYRPFSFIVASTDTTSINRLQNICMKKDNENDDKSSSSSSTKNRLELPNDDQIFKIPRAREVGQSYITSIFSTILSILSSAHIVLLKIKPDLLIINGPGTCLPIAFWTFIGRKLGLCEGKIIFCESFCRVNSLSLTGTILIKFGMVDLCLVHWQELMDTINKDYTTSTGKTKNNVKFILIDSFITHEDTSK
jgi:beta-1,4-N-acetylglucosaminyltransferase